MKIGIVTLLVLLILAVRPGATEASTQVRVQFTVGGAVMVGAGVIFWGISYRIASGLSGRVPSEADPPDSPTAGRMRLLRLSEHLRSDPKATLDEDENNRPDLIEFQLFRFRW